MSLGRSTRVRARKGLAFATACALVVAMPSIGLAADFGGEEAPPPEAFTPVPIPPVLFARPYNDLYEDHGVYYAPPYPLPYFGVFPQAGPQVAFYPQPYWQGIPNPRRHRFRR